MLSIPTIEAYVEMRVNEVEKTFTENICVLVETLLKKLDFDLANAKALSLREGPKVFAMMITNGNAKYYCRSILAATFSDYMRPHFACLYFI